MGDDAKPTAGAQQLAPQMYKATTDNITFSKRQQWAITNYTALVYAGLVGLAKSFGDVSQCERTILTILAVFTCLGAWGLLGKIQYDMGQDRIRLDTIHKELLTGEDRRIILGSKGYPMRPWLRGIEFLAALIGVVGLGAALVVWWLWRS